MKGMKGSEQGHGRDSLNSLHDKGYISNPVGKSKSIGMSEEGFLKAKELFERHFCRKATVVPLPRFTNEAKKRWHQVPEAIRNEILESVWCGRCKTGTPLQLREAKMSGRSLVLQGTCKKCGGAGFRT